MVSSGQLGLIKDKLLSIDIINYYLFCENSYNDLKKDIDNIFYREVYPVFNAYSQVEVDIDSAYANEKYLFQVDKELSLHLKNKLKKPESRLQLINAVKLKLQLQQNYRELVKENTY